MGNNMAEYNPTEYNPDEVGSTFDSESPLGSTFDSESPLGSTFDSESPNRSTFDSKSPLGSTSLLGLNKFSKSIKTAIVGDTPDALEDQIKDSLAKSKSVQKSREDDIEDLPDLLDESPPKTKKSNKFVKPEGWLKHDNDTNSLIPSYTFNPFLFESLTLHKQDKLLYTKDGNYWGFINEDGSVEMGENMGELSPTK